MTDCQKDSGALPFGCVWSVSFRPTQTGLCKFWWAWSSLKVRWVFVKVTPEFLNLHCQFLLFWGKNPYTTMLFPEKCLFIQNQGPQTMKFGGRHAFTCFRWSAERGGVATTPWWQWDAGSYAQHPPVRAKFRRSSRQNRGENCVIVGILFVNLVASLNFQRKWMAAWNFKKCLTHSTRHESQQGVLESEQDSLQKEAKAMQQSRCCAMIVQCFALN